MLYVGRSNIDESDKFMKTLQSDYYTASRRPFFKQRKSRTKRKKGGREVGRKGENERGKKHSKKCTLPKELSQRFWPSQQKLEKSVTSAPAANSSQS